MERRKFLIGLGATAAGGATALGSGAFSSAEAQREIQLAIQPDGEGAYLDFNPTSSYADTEGGGDGGILRLTFDENGGGEDGTGLTSRANTRFNGVFEIWNNGTNEVKVNLPKGDGTAAASTQFLVDEEDSNVDNAMGYESGSSVEVDSVDISWSENDDPEDKPSNPIPEIDGDFTGLRYPGGKAVIPAGESVSVDVRFTVSDPRDERDGRGPAPLIIEAEST